MPKLVMMPATAERVLRFVGDTLEFSLRVEGSAPPEGWQAFLRTNLGRAEKLRAEIVEAHTGRLPLAGASWRDIPLVRDTEGWRLEMPVHEVGYFNAKAYAIDRRGRQYWPDGPDVGITVHPDQYRTGNTIYCAFVRLFGRSKSLETAQDEAQEALFKGLDAKQVTVIPPSGTLRDLTQQLPHIVNTLGCRILHLLPINPTPTTYARFGRYGSPYASLDFTAVDPALVEFDRRANGIDQFCELTHATHALGARVFLDLAINHTGWGSTLQEDHPEWFVREPDGKFVSPGAWGTIWEDLVELSHRTPDLWACLSEAFLIWCRRGVDGFRCDAGYKVPVAAWQYIISRVRQEFPETLFLLEGLGGSWEATEQLLGEGGMQWAYSELFQNYTGREVAAYLDYSIKQSKRAGLWVHYSETHDNPRLAAKGRAWSLLRNRLCALTSVSGGFGYTCGVEWLASEKIQVHGCTGLAWDKPDNLISELRQLATLLANHPCFFDGAKLTRLSLGESPVYALRRDSSEGADRVLVLVNTDATRPQSLVLDEGQHRELGEPSVDLLGQRVPKVERLGGGRVRFTLSPAASYCLSAQVQPRGLSGQAYRLARAQAAWALTAISRVLPDGRIGSFRWSALTGFVVQHGPERFLAWLAGLDPEGAQKDPLAALTAASRQPTFPRVVVWDETECRRVVMVPPDHWLLVHDPAPFRAALRFDGGGCLQSLRSLVINDVHWLCYPPNPGRGNARLSVQRFDRSQGTAPSSSLASDAPIEGQLRFLAPAPDVSQLETGEINSRSASEDLGLALLTNGIGGMARLAVDLGSIKSKYDCLLAANLHPDFPVDRHVFAKRVRVWVNADRFLTALDRYNLVEFVPGPPARWKFVANAGDGRTVEIQLVVDMLPQRNTTVLRFSRPRTAPPKGADLSDSCDVSLTVRIDIEDRNFHTETHRNGGAEYHFSSHTRPLGRGIGFEFAPASDRYLRVSCDAGQYHHEAEWSNNISHPVEQSRGQVGSGDAYSPGWFELPLPKGAEITLVVSAERADVPTNQLQSFETERRNALNLALARARLTTEDDFGRTLALAIQAFIARRNEGKTIIAGYPWFLDWGRDSLICARGLVAAGLVEKVKLLLMTFGRFEDQGTLPNSIHGSDASNRDTSDASLWYAVVCEEMAARTDPDFYATPVDRGGRTIAGVLQSIATGYLRGTPSGIRMDAASGLIWSPKHFTWMDTNHPAGTPREGYPVEIQVLWIRLLRQLDRLQLAGKYLENKTADFHSAAKSWRELADLAESSFGSRYWLEDRGYFADLLIGGPGTPAAAAVLDTALRSNFLLAISLDLVKGERAQRAVESAKRHLAVPGALRSLAPLPVSPPLPVYSNDGRLLNDPDLPYWGRYEGDEDTRRKPAYHNGTAWTWTFPIFCEALAKAWDFCPPALAAANAYLGSLDRLLLEGCLGHVPEVVDGDAPHTQRGCDAQAWGATEAFRVWKLLHSNTGFDTHSGHDEDEPST